VNTWLVTAVQKAIRFLLEPHVHKNE